MADTYCCQATIQRNFRPCFTLLMVLSKLKDLGFSAYMFLAFWCQPASCAHAKLSGRSALTNSARMSIVEAPWVHDQINENGVFYSGDSYEFSGQSAASSPSSRRSSIYQKHSPQVPDSGRQQPCLSASSSNENSYIEDYIKSFESCRTADSSSGVHFPHTVSDKVSLLSCFYVPYITFLWLNMRNIMFVKCICFKNTYYN